MTVCLGVCLCASFTSRIREGEREEKGGKRAWMRERVEKERARPSREKEKIRKKWWVRRWLRQRLWKIGRKNIPWEEKVEEKVFNSKWLSTNGLTNLTIPETSCWEKWQKNPHIQVSRACRIISRKSLGSDCCQKCWNWARAEWPEYLWQYDYFSFSFVLRWLNKSQIPLSLEDTEYGLTDFFSADTDLIWLNVMTYYYSNENLRNVFVLKAKNVFIIYNIKFIWNERCYQWPSIPFSNSAVLWIMHNLNMKTVPS